MEYTLGDGSLSVNGNLPKRDSPKNHPPMGHNHNYGYVPLSRAEHHAFRNKWRMGDGAVLSSRLSMQGNSKSTSAEVDGIIRMLRQHSPIDRRVASVACRDKYERLIVGRTKKKSFGRAISKKGGVVDYRDEIQESKKTNIKDYRDCYSLALLHHPQSDLIAAAPSKALRRSSIHLSRD
jgi:hypothetical protein